MTLLEDPKPMWKHPLVLIIAVMITLFAVSLFDRSTPTPVRSTTTARPAAPAAAGFTPSAQWRQVNNTLQAESDCGTLWLWFQASDVEHDAPGATLAEMRWHSDLEERILDRMDALNC